MSARARVRTRALARPRRAVTRGEVEARFRRFDAAHRSQRTGEGVLDLEVDFGVYRGARDGCAHLRAGRCGGRRTVDRSLLRAHRARARTRPHRVGIPRLRCRRRGTAALHRAGQGARVDAGPSPRAARGVGRHQLRPYAGASPPSPRRETDRGFRAHRGAAPVLRTAPRGAGPTRVHTGAGHLFTGAQLLRTRHRRTPRPKRRRSPARSIPTPWRIERPSSHNSSATRSSGANRRRTESGSGSQPGPASKTRSATLRAGSKDAARSSASRSRFTMTRFGGTPP